MYDKSKVYAGTEEFQFEEIRAAKYMAMLNKRFTSPQRCEQIEEEKNRVAQVVKEERVIYPKDKVCI